MTSNQNFSRLHNLSSISFQEELKILVRCGVPHEFRARVWGDLIRMRVNPDREVAGKNYYYNLLKEKQGVYTPSAKQIELDLLRTLPNNKYYDKIESEGVRMPFGLN